MAEETFDTFSAGRGLQAAGIKEKQAAAMVSANALTLTIAGFVLAAVLSG